MIMAGQSATDYAQEIKDLTDALALMPYDAVLYASRGWAYYYNGGRENFVAAIKDFDKAIRIASECEPAYFGRATVYCAFENYQRALVDFDRVIALNPDYPDTYGCRGGVHLVLKNYKQALADFTRAIELGYETAEVYRLRGHCHKELGDDSSARADFDKANSFPDAE